MPKIINQTSVSVDSLQAKLMLLENKFAKLSTEHKAVSDSLKSLDKTLRDADIKTGFFTDQLAFQLYTILFVVTVLSYFSWKLLIKPYIDKIDKDIPHSINKLKRKMRAESKRINRHFMQVISSNYGATAAVMGYMISIFEERKDYIQLYYHLLQFVHLSIKQDDEEIDDSYSDYLKKAKEVLELEDFKMKNIEHSIEEIDDIIKFILKQDNDAVVTAAGALNTSWREKSKNFRSTKNPSN